MSADCKVCSAIQKHETSNPTATAPASATEVHAHHVTRIIKNENEVLETLKRTQDKFADTISAFAGSMRFIYIHSVWFGLWIVANLGLFSAGLKFDKYPFGLLTLIVSLEAIFLSTIVMLSQNRQGARADLRAELDYETNIRSEIWSLHIGQQLGIDPDHVERVVAQLIETARKTPSLDDSGSDVLDGTVANTDPSTVVVDAPPAAS